MECAKLSFALSDTNLSFHAGKSKVSISFCLSCTSEVDGHSRLALCLHNIHTTVKRERKYLQLRRSLHCRDANGHDLNPPAIAAVAPYECQLSPSYLG
jgi:hypothetical protein